MITDSLLCLAIPITQPGMFLSHPGIEMHASGAWAQVTCLDAVDNDLTYQQ